MKKILSVIAVIAVLGGCASQPNKITAKHVSPLKYKDENCKELCTEINLNTNRKKELFSRLKNEANADAVQTGVGLVLFWPALFFLEGGDGAEATEYSELKGNEKAILEAMKLKSCSTVAHNQLMPEKLKEELFANNAEIEALPKEEICQLPDFSEEIKKTNKK